jgi:hypothetical protein
MADLLADILEGKTTILDEATLAESAQRGYEKEKEKDKNVKYCVECEGVFIFQLNLNLNLNLEKINQLKSSAKYV